MKNKIVAKKTIKLFSLVIISATILCSLGFFTTILDSESIGENIGIDEISNNSIKSIDNYDSYTFTESEAKSGQIFDKNLLESFSNSGKIIQINVVSDNDSTDFIYFWVLDCSTTYVESEFNIYVEGYISNEKLVVNFGTAGVLPYTSTLNYYIGSDYAGNTYTISNMSDAVQDIKNFTVDNDGCITITGLSDCSYYTYIITDSSSTDLNNYQFQKMITVVLIVGVLMLGIFAISRKY
ncbi:MAG: hypothetical protein RBR05_01365 [Candidatus Methanomethylophilaceae archaeon]|nr:hypothetical protein [Candidatus Methanomethylophilaceae archaeon]MDY0224034.1 hypothetical protein [Candidatus Methanomethylophilaceae archaeon]